jgi:hypothetical protein
VFCCDAAVFAEVICGLFVACAPSMDLECNFGGT